MAKKSSGQNVPRITDPDLLRPRVLKSLVELTEKTPPLGERYEELLRGLIFEAYETANGDLGPAEPEFLNEIFGYAAGYGPMEDFFNDPQVSEIMVISVHRGPAEHRGMVHHCIHRWRAPRQS